MPSVSAGTVSRLRLESSVSASSEAGKWWNVSWQLYFEETSQASTPPWNNNGVSASVSITSLGTVWSGSFTFDWRPGGLQSVLIASGTNRVYSNPDGTPPSGFKVTGTNGATGSSGGGSGATVNHSLSLPTLKVLPNVPTGVAAARVSDTSVNVSWEQTNASNGAPTSHTIRRKINNGSWADAVTVSPTTSASLSAAANQKLVYGVKATNAKGDTAWSADSAPIYTTPAAPTAAEAAKNASLDIVVTFTPNVAYTEHEHEVWHGVVSGGVTTWDGSALATLASGVASYVHDSPNPAQVHVYRVRAKAGSLLSGYSTSNSVQLLVAPNKPTTPAVSPFADKAEDLAFGWVHNSVDTTPQTAYEFAYSTNGGSSWTSTGKVTSTASSYTRPADSHAANVALTTRVRTWGSATSGGSDGTGASPWSDLRTVTYKTKPVATITSPADSAVLDDATLRVDLGFSQAEAATFVSAELELVEAAVVLEARSTATLLGTTMETPVENDGSYTIRARVRDSNGLWSSWVENDFTVDYLLPVVPSVVVTYLPGSGWGQLDLTIADPEAGEAAADTITITRRIDGGAAEVVVAEYPAAAELSFLDTLPTIHGTNTYRVTSTSDIGAQASVTVELVTDECRRAFLSKEAGFDEVVVFGANLQVSDDLAPAGVTVQAAGRTKPIGLYGTETSRVLKVSSLVYAPFGSTIKQLQDFLLLPGKTCYRDATGRRVFGSVRGSVAYTKTTRGTLAFTLTETS